MAARHDGGDGPEPGTAPQLNDRAAPARRETTRHRSGRRVARRGDESLPRLGQALWDSNPQPVPDEAAPYLHDITS
ncbi:hypothetical protein GCM10023336_65250 [Streptomyces similanensis]|uniref:Uncharacterized protein n=1 Tax=Streptomyces similanensis TaxID=1274988 RepID=A0ABP9LCJ2_9ACTN